MNLKTKIVIGTIVILVCICSALGYFLKKTLAENKRQSHNFENLVKLHNQELVLTREEFKLSETSWRLKIDSLLKANKILLNKVKTITIVSTVYKDTGSVIILSKEPIQKPDKSYSIPVIYTSKCWGLSGQILTVDKDAKFRLDEKRANNNYQLLVTRKRFLGFLWWTKDERFRLFSDCGEGTFTKISFVK